MQKKTTAILAVLGGAAVAAAAAHAYHQYWYRWLPNRLFKKVKRELADPAKITGGWINMEPDAGWQNDHIVASYRGGVTTTSGLFTFEVAENGELLQLTRS